MQRIKSGASPLFPVIAKDHRPFDPADDDMMQGTGSIDARLARHNVQIPKALTYVNKGTTSL
jgi:hypothetical protein